MILCAIYVYIDIYVLATKTDLSLDRAFPQYQQGRVDFNSAHTLLFREARISWYISKGGVGDDSILHKNSEDT